MEKNITSAFFIVKSAIHEVLIEQIWSPENESAQQQNLISLYQLYTSLYVILTLLVIGALLKISTFTDRQLKKLIARLA